MRKIIIIFAVLLMFCNTAIATTKDTTNFGPYMRELQAKIKGNWHPQRGNKSAQVKVLFRIDREGNISKTKIISSTNNDFNANALEAVSKSSPFKPLPSTFSGKFLDIEFTFDYNDFDSNQNNIPVNNYSNNPPVIGTNQFLKDIGNKEYEGTPAFKKYKKEIDRIILQNLPAEKFPLKVTAQISLKIKKDGQSEAIITRSSGRRDFDELVLKSLQNCVFPKFPDEIEYENLILHYEVDSAHGSNYRFVPIILPLYPMFYGVR